MLIDGKTAEERWARINQVIERWLVERQEMLVSFCAISDAEESAEREQRLRCLCQLLVDYVSAGHFEIYDQLIQEGRTYQDRDGLKQASDLFTIIDKTTEKALDFNDKYLETDDLSALDTDLSALSDTLETRFTAEDQMINILHLVHKDLVSS
jgi:regulator of sigma D